MQPSYLMFVESHLSLGSRLRFNQRARIRCWQASSILPASRRRRAQRPRQASLIDTPIPSWSLTGRQGVFATLRTACRSTRAAPVTWRIRRRGSRRWVQSPSNAGSASVSMSGRARATAREFNTGKSGRCSRALAGGWPAQRSSTDRSALVQGSAAHPRACAHQPDRRHPAPRRARSVS